MLYEQYQRRMIRLAGFLGFLRRFRVLIICVLLSVLGIVATFLGLSGLVYDKSVCPTEITFGDELGYDAGAIFKSVTYEFSVQGSDLWTTNQPIRPGDYLVRSYSNGPFGTRYGNTYAFKILPREIDVFASEDDIVYGETPTASAATCYNDTIHCTKFNFEDKSKPETGVSPDKDFISATDEEGNDVSSSYIFNPVTKNIAFKQRSIDIIFDDYKTTYEGKELVYKTYAISEETPLAEGDKEVVVDMRFGPDVGVTEMQPEISVFADGGTLDVTGNYKINVKFTENGTLTVEKRPLYLTMLNADSVYSGRDFSSADYVMDEECRSFLQNLGHRFVILDSTKVKNVTDGVKNVITDFAVYDKEGNEVTDNYSIIYSADAYLKVSKRKVVIHSADDATQIFDGTAKTSLSFYTVLYSDSFELVDGDTCVVTKSTYEVNAGDYENVLEVKILNRDGEDVTENYALDYKYGTFTIKPRPIVVVTGNGEWIYDGQPHTKGEIVEVTGMIDDLGHTVVVKELSSVTEVGSVNNNLVVGVYDEDGNIVTENYEVHITAGKLEITPRPVTVAPEYAEKVYDGTPLTSSALENVNPDYPLVSGHTLSGETEGEQTDAGESANKVLDENSVKVLDAEGNDVTKNYKISGSEEGRLKVIPRPITFTAGSAEKVYDDTPLTCDTYSIDMEELPNAQTAVVQISGSITDAGSAENIIETVEIFEGERNVNFNYAITYEKGTLKILLRPVKITTLGQTFEYDGTPHSYSGHTAQPMSEGEGLLSHHQTEAYDLAEITGVAESGKPNTLKVKIFELKGEDKLEKTGNYFISYSGKLDSGKLEVTPRPVTVQTLSDEKEFDNEALIEEGYNVISDKGFIESDLPDIFVAKNTEMTFVLLDEEGNVTSKPNVLELGMPHPENYNITYEYGTLTITKLKVEFTTADATLVYNGLPQSSIAGTLDRFVVGYALLVDENNVTTQTDVTAADGVDNEVTEVEVIRDPNSGKDGETINVHPKLRPYSPDELYTYNFEFSYKYGKLKIDPRPVTIAPENITAEFDGNAHSPEKVNQLPEGYGIVNKHTAEVTYSGEGTYVGTYESEIKDIKIYDEAHNDVTHNYKITTQVGSIEITPREIIITAKSAEKVYDGKPLTSHEYTLSRPAGKGGATLVLNHNIAGETLVFPNSQTIKGTNSNALDISNLKIYDQSGADVTNNYSVKTESGTLTVTVRHITITTLDKEWIYGGIDYSYTEKFTIEEQNGDSGLVKGQTCEADLDKPYSKIKDVGETQNEFEVKILDGETDVTESYEIEYVYSGTLEITPREITITSETHVFVYNGEMQYWRKKEVTNFLSTQSMQIDDSGWAGITNVYDGDDGKVENAISADAIKIYEQNGDLVPEKDYKITIVAGILTVSPRPITVAAADDTYVYDGEEHYGANFKTVGSVGLVKDHTLEGTTNESAIDAGEYEITVKEGSVVVKDDLGGDERVAENYEVSYDSTPAKLTINQRPISIETATNSWTYDDEDHFDDTFKLVEGNLVKDHKASVAYPDTVRKVHDVIYSGNEISYETNDFTVKIFDGSGEDVTKNYKIDYRYGSLTINPRKINVYPDNATKTYDATPLTCETYTYDIEDGDIGLLESKGHTLIAQTEGSQTDAGNSPNKIVEGSVKIISETEGDVTYNYEINTPEGTLTVNQREVHVKTLGQEWTYDGEEHSYQVFNYVPYPGDTGIINNDIAKHRIVVDTYTTVKDVIWTENALGVKSVKGTPNELWFKVESIGEIDPETSKNRDVTPNYKIVVDEKADLIIHPRLVRVVTKTATDDILYDGDEHSLPELEYVEPMNGDRGIIGSETYEIIEDNAAKGENVGDYENKLEIRIVDSSNNLVDKTSNYLITYEYGKFRIVPRKLVITTNNADKKYDGTPLICDDKNPIGGDGLVKDHWIYYYEWASITAIGSITNSVNIEVYDGNSDPFTYNYIFDAYFEFGTLEITGPKDNDQEYDKTPDISIGDGEGTEFSDPPVLAVKVFSTASGPMYLRYESYGDTFFNNYYVAGTEYSGRINGSYSPNYYASLALKAANAELASAKIKVLGHQYYLPYYMDTNNTDEAGHKLYDIQTSDVSYSGDCSSQYEVPYYIYDFKAMGLPKVSFSAGFDENAYYEFVKENYLGTFDTDGESTETLEYLQGIINREHLNDPNEDLLSRIYRAASYIQRSATYNMSYDRNLDNEEKLVLSFLTTYRQGVCRHYARAATMLYRAMGIPARYVVGYKTETVKGEWVEVTTKDAHAWVEVYIKGFGWMQVEVTGFTNDGTDKDVKEVEKVYDNYGEGGIVLRPADEVKFHDGEPLAATKLEDNMYLSELLSLGFTYRVSFAGEQTEIGVGESEITAFVLYGPNGHDITEEFRSKIIFEKGKLTVLDPAKYDKIIYVHANSHTDYDGTAQTFGLSGVYFSFAADGYSLAEGYSAKLTVLQQVYYTSPIHVGGREFEENYVNTNNVSITVTKDGEEVSARCYFVYDIDLEISRLNITIATDSKTDVYEYGKSLTHPEFHVSLGSLLDGDKIEAYNPSSITEVGSAENKMDFKIFHGEEEVTNNYFIVKEYGTLTLEDD